MWNKQNSAVFGWVAVGMVLDKMTLCCVQEHHL